MGHDNCVTRHAARGSEASTTWLNAYTDRSRQELFMNLQWDFMVLNILLFNIATDWQAELVPRAAISIGIYNCNFKRTIKIKSPQGEFDRMSLVQAMGSWRYLPVIDINSSCTITISEATYNILLSRWKVKTITNLLHAVNRLKTPFSEMQANLIIVK